jgi:hypothetical protein
MAKNYKLSTLLNWKITAVGTLLLKIALLDSCVLSMQAIHVVVIATKQKQWGKDSI